MPIKKKLLIACDYWHPVASANLVCIEAVAPFLAKDYDLVFLTADAHPSTYAGVSGRCVDDLAINGFIKRYQDNPMMLGLVKAVNKFAVAFNVLRFPIRSKKMVDDYEDSIRGLLSEGGFAGVLAVCYPGECIEACVRLRNDFPDIFFVAYYLDELAVGMYRKGYLLREISSRAAIAFEERALAVFDGAIFLDASKGLVEHNHPERLGVVKFVDVPFMKCDSITYRCGIAADGPAILLYAGTLANPDRNPARFIEAVRPLVSSGSLVLKFAGDTAGLLDGVDEVENLGMLAPDDCDKLMAKADILLSIGNMDPYLIPSKLFKYMSLGKPIVHLRRGGKDSCIPYLERYPLAVVVDEADADAAIALECFLSELPAKDGLEIPLRQLFPMAYPEYTVAAIESIARTHREADKE